jgi:hypothetical protein
MKKQFSLALVILLSMEVFAQIPKSTIASFSSNLSEKTSIASGQRAAGGPASIASIDTIWSDDFSDSLNWAYTGGADEWNVADSLSSSLILQGFDAQINSNSGGLFASIDSDGSGSTGVQDAIIEYTGGVIDCSLYPDVRLVFQTYLRQYQETRQVIISNDGGTVWDTIPVLTQFGPSVTSPNGYTEIVDITAFAGGQANVKIKFRYLGAFDWFWAIDDVRIVSAPNNELALTQEYYNTTSDLTSSTFYKSIPIRQADSSIINFGAKFINNGVANQPNTKVIANVNYSGSVVYSDTSDSVNSAPNAASAVNFNNMFSANNGMGRYEVQFEVSSDSIDELPRNNIISNYFEVSGNQYRRDNDSITNDNWFDVTSTWEMLVMYEIYAEDTVVAISTFFPYSIVSGRGVSDGDSISYYLYAASDLENPVSSYENYYVQSTDINSWITLPMPVATLTPGIYYAGFKVHNNTSSVGTNSQLNGSTAPLTVLLRRNATVASDPWEYTTSFTPFIRMYTKSADACNGVNIAIVDSINDSTTYGAINIDVSGGAPPYTYLWSGPDSFSANTQDIDYLVNRGTYHVTVTDVFGCEGTDSSVVAGSVTVQEINALNTLVLFPNPSDGRVFLKGDDLDQSKYTVSVYSMVGKQLFMKEVDLSNQYDRVFDLSHLNPGLYFVTVSTGNTEQKTLKLILN